MTSWLDPVRSALDGGEAPVTLYVRDDDAGWDDDRQLRLIAVFEERGVHIDLAAIPDALRPPMAATLVTHSRAGLVHLHQHGRRHANHEAEGRKCEFGPSRGFAEQLADIAEGRERLLTLLGDALEPVFTPPWNRCTADTGAALVQVGVRVLSRDHTAGLLGVPGLAEVPVNVDWFAKSKGVPLGRDGIGALIATRIASGGPVGLMLHHAVTDAADMAAIADLVDVLARHPRVVSTSLLQAAPAAATP